MNAFSIQCKTADEFRCESTYVRNVRLVDIMSNLHHENVVVNTNIGIRFWRSAVTTAGYVPFHWHSSIEIVCVLKGRLNFTINGQSFVVRSDHFIVVPSGVVHDVANIPNTAYVLQIPLKVIEPYVKHPELVTFNNGMVDDPNYSLALKLIKKFAYLQLTHPDGFLFDSQITFVSLLKVIFMKLNNPDKQVPNDNNVKQLLIYINNHSTEQLTVTGLARHFGYNPNYLSRLFKKHVRLSLTNYIYVVKLNQLYNDLINTDIAIKDLFKKHGLSNPRTARKVFREMFGELPNEIRLSHRPN